VKNPGLKLLSLCIAALLAWFVNSEGNSSVFTFLVPVEVRGVPPAKVVVEPHSRQVQVTIKGPSFVLARILGSPPSFRVTVPAAVAGRHVATLQRSDLALPPYVDVLSIEPTEIELILDDLIEKQVPLNVPKIGAVAPGHELTRLQIIPETVKLSGPARELKSITGVETEPIDLRGLSSDEQRTVRLRLPGTMLQASPQEVLLDLQVASLQVVRRFPERPIEVRSIPGRSYAVAPGSVAVQVRGRRELLEGLDPGAIIPFVRVPGDDKRLGRVAVSVEAPEGVTVESVDPAEAEIIQSKTPGSAPRPARGSGARGQP